MNTQYYMRNSGGGITQIQNQVSYGGFYRLPYTYPRGVCYNQATGWNCLTDAWIQWAVKKAQYANGWGGGYRNIFRLSPPKKAGP